MINVSEYTDLITNEHANKEKFIATVQLISEDYVDIMNVMNELIVDFDIDTAVGYQLDTVGLWIGQTRNITVPISGVYFQFDGNPVTTGWDAGQWKGVGQESNTTLILDDDLYRSLLKSKILSNNWKGDRESIYSIIDAFVVTPTPITVTDNQDMTQTVTLTQAELTQDQIDIITSGYIQITPAGVKTNYALI